MKYRIALLCLLTVTNTTAAAEILFNSGPQQFADRPYYWLAEWQIEVTLPPDTASTDRLEVLFGTKGRDKRTFFFQYNQTSNHLSHAEKQDGYTWLPIPITGLAPGKKVTLRGKGSNQVAFLAGVRITGKSKTVPKVKLVNAAKLFPLQTAKWSNLPGFELNERNVNLWHPAPTEPDWPRAQRSAKYASIALTKVQRWLHEECLPIRDNHSGLFRPTGPQWNYRDTAADCYPFYVWAAFYTDKHILDTLMVDTLEAEQRLCNHVDRLPVRYDMDAQKKIATSHGAMVFGACEYAKDGLVPIVEITGPDAPWFDRMKGIVDDIFKHARVDTAHGKIPTTNIEIHGELLQILPRLYSITGDRKYLDWAHRLADHYLLPGKFVPSRLCDHGSEIVGGLGLLFAVDTTEAHEKATQYRPHLEYMFDQILQRGTNSDGVIVSKLADTPGPHDNVLTADGWGYDFVGFLDYDLALNTNRYQNAIRRPMTSLLKPRYLNFDWDTRSRDNIADSVEGGLYLLHRIPVPEAFIWADREIATCLVDHTIPDRLWGTHKLEANTVRTVLVHTMLHTRNIIARPYQPHLQLGAAPYHDGVCVYLAAEKPYQGRLHFDIPRHRHYMGFRKDWPRMNAVPEFFTVEPDTAHAYEILYPDTQESTEATGQFLSEGLPITLKPNIPLKLIVTPQQISLSD